MIFNKIKTFYHKNEIIRDYVYMIGLFLNLIDTQTEKDKFQLLYDTYCDLLYWIALKRTNCIEDAEECVQETFLYIAKHFDKIGEINSKKTKIYLSTIVTGFAIDIYNNSQKAKFIEIENDNETADLKYYDVILKPVITEKSMNAMAEKKYTFLVHPDANKTMIKEAVERMFEGTKVAKVNTMNCEGKNKRRGMVTGKTAKTKKAIVQLTADSKDIEIFAGL